MQQEISIRDVIRFVRKNIFSFIMCTIIGAIISGVYLVLFVDPTYSSQAQLIVNQGTQVNQPLQYNQIQTNVSLINTYRDIILADDTLTTVNENLGSNYSVGTLQNAISVSQQPNSQAFNIRATMESPEEAQRVVETVVDVFTEHVSAAYETNDPSIYVLSAATYNPNKVAPSTTNYIIIGAIVGLIVSIGYQLLKMMMDTTITDSSYMDGLRLLNLGEVSSISKKTRKKTRIPAPVEFNRSKKKV